MKKLFVFLAVTTLVFSMFGTSPRGQGEIACEPPPGLGQNAAWRRGSIVNLYIDDRFGTTGQDIIATQIGLWNAGTNFGVDFQVKHTAQDMGNGAAGGGNVTWFIFQDTPSQGHQGQTGGFSFNGRRGDSTTYIDPGVTTALSQVASHEIGHSFGLDDCVFCSQGSSAMTLAPSADLNALGGHSGPTVCDICAVWNNELGISTVACTLLNLIPPVSQEPCEANNMYWNFTNSTCGSTPAVGMCSAGPDWGNYPSTGCYGGLSLLGGSCNRSTIFQKHCYQHDGDYNTQYCVCTGCDWCGGSPILIDVNGDGFAMTDVAH